MGRLYLSPPDLAGNELTLLQEALDSNWIAPLGPHIDAFEREMCAVVGVPHAVACSSGTAALHLALDVLGVHRGDEVWLSTLTFAATANAVVYTGATPVFVDSNTSWNIDPELLADALEQAAAKRALPKAIIAVDLYGQCADYNALVPLCKKYEVPLIEDAAESLGATYAGQPAGSFGELSVLSFNGNKIITTSGGGMLLGRNKDHVERARYLATQARSPARHYEHHAVGYNYRLSNLLAAVGRAQLADLDRRVVARRATNLAYRMALGDLGWSFMEETPGCMSTFWLTCATLQTSALRDRVLDALADADIEARPVWKPMHRQPVFATARAIGGAVAERLFECGLCLPSGSRLTDEERQRVISVVRRVVS